MTKIHRPVLLAGLLAMLAIGAIVAAFTGQGGSAWAAQEDEPKLSSYAPISDLTAEADDLIGQIDKDLASEEEYKKKSKLVAQNAYTLAIVAHAVLQHDEKDKAKWSGNAGQVRDAAIVLAEAKTYADAQSQPKKIKDLLSGGAADGQARELKWNEIAPLKEVMVVVNRRDLNGVRQGLRRKQPEAARHATIIALLARVARDDHHEVKNPSDLPKWTSGTDELRQGFAELAGLIRERKTEEANKKFKANQNICSDCHKVFRPDVEM